MAPPKQRGLVDRLADAGEEAIQRLGSAPGGERLLGAVNTLRDRMDEMQKKLRGLDALEQRLAAVERRLDKLEGKGTSQKRKRSASPSRSSTPSSSSSTKST